MADAALVMGGVDGTRVEVVGNGAGVVKEAEGVTLDDDDLHGGPVSRLFAQLRRELGEDVDPSIHGGILRQLQTRHSKNC